jgi:phenylacetate-CoA ligase
MSVQRMFAKHIAFPILNRQTSHHLKYMEKSQWFSIEKIRSIQWEKLSALLKHVETYVPYYKTCFKKRGIISERITSFEEFHDVPLLKKKDIRENFKDMIALNCDQRNLFRQTTSGSTGEPVTTLRDRRTEAIVSASGLRFRRYSGQDVGVKYGQIWGRSPYLVEANTSRRSFLKKLKKVIKDLTEPILFLSAYDMSEANMEIFAKTLQTEKVPILVGYANPVYFFAQFVRERKIRLTFKSVRTVSEVLDIHQRKLIENVFDCKVFNTYGNRENGLIAAECDQHSGFHMNAENLYIEILDAAGNPVKGEETGEIAVTDLNNYGMPLLRYMTGDRAHFVKEPCRCGRGLPLMGEISGRIIDMIALSDGEFIDGLVLGHALWSFADDIDRFTVIQHKQGEAKLAIKPLRSITEDRLLLIENNLRRFTQNKLALDITLVDDLPVDPVSGKFRVVVSHIKQGRVSDLP